MPSFDRTDVVEIHSLASPTLAAARTRDVPPAANPTSEPTTVTEVAPVPATLLCTTELGLGAWNDQMSAVVSNFTATLTTHLPPKAIPPGETLPRVPVDETQAVVIALEPPTRAFELPSALPAPTPTIVTLCAPVAAPFTRTALLDLTLSNVSVTKTESNTRIVVTAASLLCPMPPLLRPRMLVCDVHVVDVVRELPILTLEHTSCSSMLRPTTVTALAPVAGALVGIALLTDITSKDTASRNDPGTIAVVTTMGPDSFPPPPANFPNMPVDETQTELSPPETPIRTAGVPSMFTATTVTLVAPVVAALVGPVLRNAASLYDSST